MTVLEMHHLCIELLEAGLADYQFESEYTDFEQLGDIDHNQKVVHLE